MSLTPAAPFSLSRTRLAGDTLRRSFPWLALAGFFLLSWGGWLTCSEVRLYEVASEARLETAMELHPVDSPLAGRVVAVHAELADEVAAGAALFDLDSGEAELELAEAEARFASLHDQLESIGREAELVARLLLGERAAGGERLRAARSQQEVEAIEGRFAASEHERALELHEEGLLSDLERQRYLGEVEKSRARAVAESADVDALLAELQSQQTDLEIRAAHLEHERVAVLGEVASLAAHIEHLRHDVAERRIVAPVGGRLARVADVRVGSVVAVGERLADVLPDGGIRAVAWFPPSALGRLAPGQHAWLRLDAYPWTEFGAVEATVERVAGEPSSGRLRAELALGPSVPAGVSLQHGLTASAEVAVETVTPARWVLRAAGGAHDRRPGAGD